MKPNKNFNCLIHENNLNGVIAHAIYPFRKKYMFHEQIFKNQKTNDQIN